MMGKQQSTCHGRAKREGRSHECDLLAGVERKEAAREAVDVCDTGAVLAGCLERRPLHFVGE